MPAKRPRLDDDRRRMDPALSRRGDGLYGKGYFPPGKGMKGGKGADRAFAPRGPPREQVVRKEINRQEVCPLLLRVFVKQGGHHAVEEFYNRAQDLVEEEVQIYTWKDATLLELTQLIQQVKPFAKERGVILKFNLVQAVRGKYTERYLGLVKGDAKRSDDDRKMLQETPFEIGDYIDVAVIG